MATVHALLRLLDEAIALVSGYGNVNLYSGYDTGVEFAADLQRLREQVARQEWSALDELFAIFAPTCAWDDAVGSEGVEIAEKIMKLLDEMRWTRRSG